MRQRLAEDPAYVSDILEARHPSSLNTIGMLSSNLYAMMPYYIYKLDIYSHFLRFCAFMPIYIDFLFG